MARIRSIHPDACDSEKLSLLSDSAERTLWRLITHTDDEGRGEDRPKLLAAKLYPLADDKDAGTVTADLDELEDVGMLARYSVRGRAYYVLSTFGDWQKPRHPSPSKYPSPDEDDGSVPADRGTTTADRRKAPAGEEWSGEGVGEGPSPGEDAEPLTLIAGSGSSADADGAFDDWWANYPRKTSKDDARRAFRRALTKGPRRPTLNDLHDALRLQGDIWRREGRQKDKIPHAATWLNGRRWEDEDLTAPPPDPAQPQRMVER